MLTLTSNQGWIGIDAGASSVKLAQVARTGDGLQVRRAALAPRDHAWSSDLVGGDPLSSFAEIESALAISGAKGMRRTAGALSMSVCDVAPGQITSPVGAGVCADDWQADATLGEEGWYTFSTSEPIADRLCEDIRQVKLSCHTIDAMPHALARAVAWAAPAAGKRTLAALDWGYSDVLFCSVQSGRPVYVRSLRDCGLKHLEQELISELGLERGEACELIAGVASGTQGQEAADLIAELARPLIDRLRDELARTLEHLKSHRKPVMPERLFTFGGGATLGAERLLAERAGCKISAWTLPGCDPPQAGPLCLFGPAIALSALAWEGRA